MDIVFRASGLGFPCPRKVWYEAVEERDEPHTPEQELTMDIGTALEPLFVKYLTPPYDEWEVLYNPGSQDAEFEVEIVVDKGILIRGHPDAHGMRWQGAGPWILPDFKTMNSFAYKQWKKFGTLAKYPQYAFQVHCYGMSEEAKSMGIDTFSIVGMKKDKAEHPLPVDVFPRDPEIDEAILSRAREIANYVEPPEPPMDLPAWCCNYCGFADICNHNFFE